MVVTIDDLLADLGDVLSLLTDHRNLTEVREILDEGNHLES